MRDSILNAGYAFLFPLIVTMNEEHGDCCCPFSASDVWLHCTHDPSVVPGDEGMLDVTFEFTDELANQGFAAITDQDGHIFIYLFS